MKLLALKIDVDTAKAVAAVPHLAELLRSHQADATFFWSLGEERNGVWLRPGYGLRQMPGSSYIPLRERYARSELILGSLQPVRGLFKLAKRYQDELTEAGFEHALRPLSRYHWQLEIARWDAETTKVEMYRARDAHTRCFGVPARGHSAFGGQMNRQAFRYLQMAGYAYSCDTRGVGPYWPIVEGEYVRVPQLPVTLPMLEELVQRMSAEDAVLHILHLSEQAQQPQVFNFAADFDSRYPEAIAALLTGWLLQGYQLVGLDQLLLQLDVSKLPYHHVVKGEVSGRKGQMALQGAVYP